MTVEIRNEIVRTIQIQDKRIVVKEPSFKIVQVAQQGPPGPPSDLIEIIGGEGGINPFHVVYIDSHGMGKPASCLNPTHFGKIIGIAMTMIPEGETGNVKRYGEIVNNDWNLTPGTIYLLGDGGEITETPPSIGFFQRIGVGKTDHTLVIDLGEPVMLL